MTSYALIVGGGTAGHVLPGIAIGHALVARGHHADTIHFVGSERGVETRLVPEAGFELTVLPGRGIQRRLTRENVGSVLGLLRAFVRSRSMLRHHRPQVVVALGGYASIPAGLWAALRRVPIVVAEQNAVPGLANRILGRFARVCAVSFEHTDLPRSVWTGNPVRPEILAVADADADTIHRARATLEATPDERVVVVFGGSLGARTINDALIGALERFQPDQPVLIRHIIGHRDHADVVERVREPAADRVRYVPIRYEDDMATTYAAADLVVCRSGATSCSELAATGTPSVLVPLPGAPGDHQTANARALERVGGAVIVPDADLDAASLVAAIESLLDEPERLADMGIAARTIARPDAADAVADLVERHAREAR